MNSIDDLLALIKKQVIQLDYAWFRQMKDFYQIQKMLGYKGIETLTEYCWDCKSDDLATSGQIQAQHTFFPLSHLGSIIAGTIVAKINTFIQGFTNERLVYDILFTATENIKAKTQELIDENPDGDYRIILENFENKTNDIIKEKFKHIYLQHNLLALSSSSEKYLTIENCKAIANFKLGKKKLISNVSPNDKEGEVLFSLLNSKEKIIPGAKLYVSDWENNDVYYLLDKINKDVTDSLNFSKITRKNILVLIDSATFDHNSFFKWRKRGKDKYNSTNPNKATIDKQIALLF